MVPIGHRATCPFRSKRNEDGVSACQERRCVLWRDLRRYFAYERADILSNDFLECFGDIMDGGSGSYEKLSNFGLESLQIFGDLMNFESFDENKDEVTALFGPAVLRGGNASHQIMTPELQRLIWMAKKTDRITSKAALYSFGAKNLEMSTYLSSRRAIIKNVQADLGFSLAGSNADRSPEWLKPLCQKIESALGASTETHKHRKWIAVDLMDLFGVSANRIPPEAEAVLRRDPSAIKRYRAFGEKALKQAAGKYFLDEKMNSFDFSPSDPRLINQADNGAGVGNINGPTPKEEEEARRDANRLLMLEKVALFAANYLSLRPILDNGLPDFTPGATIGPTRHVDGAPTNTRGLTHLSGRPSTDDDFVDVFYSLVGCCVQMSLQSADAAARVNGGTMPYSVQPHELTESRFAVGSDRWQSEMIDAPSIALDWMKGLVERMLYLDRCIERLESVALARLDVAGQGAGMVDVGKPGVHEARVWSLEETWKAFAAAFRRKKPATNVVNMLQGSGGVSDLRMTGAGGYAFPTHPHSKTDKQKAFVAWLKGRRKLLGVPVFGIDDPDAKEANQQARQANAVAAGINGNDGEEGMLDEDEEEYIRENGGFGRHDNDDYFGGDGTHVFGSHAHDVFKDPRYKYKTLFGVDPTAMPHGGLTDSRAGKGAPQWGRGWYAPTGYRDNGLTLPTAPTANGDATGFVHVTDTQRTVANHLLQMDNLHSGLDDKWENLIVRNVGGRLAGWFPRVFLTPLGHIYVTLTTKSTDTDVRLHAPVLVEGWKAYLVGLDVSELVVGEVDRLLGGWSGGSNKGLTKLQAALDEASERGERSAVEFKDWLRRFDSKAFKILPGGIMAGPRGEYYRVVAKPDDQVTQDYVNDLEGAADVNGGQRRAQLVQLVNYSFLTDGWRFAEFIPVWDEERRHKLTQELFGLTTAPVGKEAFGEERIPIKGGDETANQSVSPSMSPSRIQPGDVLNLVYVTPSGFVYAGRGEDPSLCQALKGLFKAPPKPKLQLVVGSRVTFTPMSREQVMEALAETKRTGKPSGLIADHSGRYVKPTLVSDSTVTKELASRSELNAKGERAPRLVRLDGYVLDTRRVRAAALVPVGGQMLREPFEVLEPYSRQPVDVIQAPEVPMGDYNIYPPNEHHQAYLEQQQKAHAWHMEQQRRMHMMAEESNYSRELMQQHASMYHHGNHMGGTAVAYAMQRAEEEQFGLNPFQSGRNATQAPQSYPPSPATPARPMAAVVAGKPNGDGMPGTNGRTVSTMPFTPFRPNGNNAQNYNNNTLASQFNQLNASMTMMGQNSTFASPARHTGSFTGLTTAVAPPKSYASPQYRTSNSSSACKQEFATTVVSPDSRVACDVILERSEPEGVLHWRVKARKSPSSSNV